MLKCSIETRVCEEHFYGHTLDTLHTRPSSTTHLLFPASLHVDSCPYSSLQLLLPSTMASVPDNTGRARPQATESDPFLDQPHDGRQDGDTSEAELIKEPSNAELAFIMGSLWV